MDNEGLRRPWAAHPTPSALAAANWESPRVQCHRLLFTPKTKRASVAELRRLGTAIDTAVTELSAGAGPQAVINVIDAGFPESLVGLPENEWFEAKSQAWDLSTDFGKLELARDVARFANAPSGGLIIVGAATKKADGEETVSAVRGIDAARFLIQRARSVIEHRVYPTIAGLAIRTRPIASSDLCVAYLLIPPQDLALQPFLVRSAITGKSIDGTAISIVSRRGSGSESVGVEEFHALLAAGRRALRGRDPLELSGRTPRAQPRSRAAARKVAPTSAADDRALRELEQRNLRLAEPFVTGVINGVATYDCPYCDAGQVNANRFARHLAKNHPGMGFPADRADALARKLLDLIDRGDRLRARFPHPVPTARYVIEADQQAVGEWLRTVLDAAESRYPRFALAIRRAVSEPIATAYRRAMLVKGDGSDDEWQDQAADHRLAERIDQVVSVLSNLMHNLP